MMEDTLQHCLPLIRFFSLSSEDFFQKVHPYKKLLKSQLHEDLLKFYLVPNSKPSDNILPPRKKIDGIIDTKIVNSTIASIISRWIDRINDDKFTRGLYLPYEFKLLLRGSRDGFTPKKFHELCDNIPCTVTFIKVKGTEEILGGYNPLIWESSGKWVKTKDSFIFSFKSKDNFKDPILSYVKNIDYAFWDHPACGPSFGDTDLYLFSGKNDSNGCILKDYEKNIRDTNENFSTFQKIMDTNGNFSIEDYEVFQIL